MTAMSVRTLGVEEEFLLVDPATGRPVPVAPAVLAGAPAGVGAGPGLPLEQVGTVAAGLRDLDDLRATLAGLRRGVATAAAHHGAALVASGTSPFPASSRRTPDARYQRMVSAFGVTAREHPASGCHVHVGVTSADEGVAAIERMRPWLPVVMALAANSPFWRGTDTGYASYRSQVCSVDVRLAHRDPALEVRVADAALDVDDAVLVAALVRALVDTSAREWHEGFPARSVRPELARLATWRAARSGLGGVLVDIGTRRPVPARVLVGRLVRHVQESLDAAGDLAVVEELVAALLARGTGAARQREAFRRGERLEDVVRMLAERTAPDLAPSLAR